MKVVISVCTFATAIFLAAGAPALHDVFIPEPTMYNGPQFLRGPRSYGGAAYASPCAGSLPLGPVGGYYGPVHSGLGVGVGGVGGYGGAGYGVGGHGAFVSHGGGYGYGAPHYRSDEATESEMLNFSDMEQGMSEHQPMARYGGYGGAVAAHGAGLGGLAYGGVSSALASGPAFGVFPNANVGGCNVPLLLSCSPSIVPGRLVKGAGYGAGHAAGLGVGSAGLGVGAAGLSGVGAAGYGGSGAALVASNAYRGVEDQSHSETEEHSEEMTSHSVSDHTNDSIHTETH